MSEEVKAPKKKKKQSSAQIQQELRDLSKPAEGSERPPLALDKLYWRAGAVVLGIWALSLAMYSWMHARWPLYVALALTAATVGFGIWFVLYMRKTEALGAILRGADTEEGRKEAIKKLETDFKKGDTQATMTRAQLEMQEDPRKALATLESLDLNRILTPMADQVRALRAMLHLQLGETAQARTLADALELGKQQEPKTRAMFATVAGEAWARSGAGKKAVETLELFNPEDADNAEMRVQMWRARAFAYAATNDMKAAERALKKLADTNINLMAMFIGSKKVHPLLERSAKQILMRSGAAPRRMVRQR